MNSYRLNLVVGLAMAAVAGVAAGWPAFAAEAPEQPCGKALTEANKERLVLDDMEDVSGWDNGSPVETTLSRSDAHVKQGHFSLKFANLVDHTKGEKNYPIGWPRTGRNLVKAKLTDWSEYDFFECWIFVETSRATLPGTPLGIGFYHGGHKQSTSVPLKQVSKGEWTKIVIPIAELKDAKDVRRVQFNISESDYKHGDRVDFYIDDVALTRFVQPAIAELALQRKVLYTSTPIVAATYKLVGRKGMEQVSVEFEIGVGDAAPVAKVAARALREGELAIPIRSPLPVGHAWVRLGLRDGQGKLIDRKQVEFRVIQGPF